MPAVVEIPALARALASATPGAPIGGGAFTVVPLLADSPEPGWLTLADAAGRVTIGAVDEQARLVEARNAGDRPAVLLEGETATGAGEDGALDTTVLLAAGASAWIPVSPAEQGRWAWRGLAAGRASLLASLRRTPAARATAPPAAGHEGDPREREPRDRIASRIATHGIGSPGVDVDAMHERVAAYIAWSRRTARARRGQAGAVVFIAGRWAGLDLLASPGLFARAWPRLCAGYAAGAVGVPPARANEVTPETVLAAVLAAPLQAAPAVGLGTRYRLGGELAGAALVHEERLVHLAAFAAPAGG
jgi:hypothetical protein